MGVYKLVGAASNRDMILSQMWTFREESMIVSPETQEYMRSRMGANISLVGIPGSGNVFVLAINELTTMLRPPLLFGQPTCCCDGASDHVFRVAPERDRSSGWDAATAAQRTQQPQ